MANKKIETVETEINKIPETEEESPTASRERAEAKQKAREQAETEKPADLRSALQIHNIEFGKVYLFKPKKKGESAFIGEPAERTPNGIVFSEFRKGQIIGTRTPIFKDYKITEIPREQVQTLSFEI